MGGIAMEEKSKRRQLSGEEPKKPEPEPRAESRPSQAGHVLKHLSAFNVEEFDEDRRSRKKKE